MKTIPGGRAGTAKALPSSAHGAWPGIVARGELSHFVACVWKARRRRGANFAEIRDDIRNAIAAGGARSIERSDPLSRMRAARRRRGCARQSGLASVTVLAPVEAGRRNQQASVGRWRAEDCLAAAFEDDGGRSDRLIPGGSDVIGAWIARSSEACAQ